MAEHFRLIRQRDEQDCGPACLASLARYYGAEASVAQLRELSGTDQEGTTLLGLAEAAQKAGLEATGFQATFADLADLPLPAIAHWEDRHYVVLLRWGPEQVLIADPAVGRRQLPAAKFQESWTGYVLVVQPPAVRAPAPARSSGSMTRFLRLLGPQRVTIAETVICSLILAGLALAGPMLLQVLTDEILVRRQTHTLNWLMLAMLVLLAFTVLFTVLRRYLLAHLGRWLDLTLMRDYYEHVIRLPGRFFGGRKVGEILSRFNDAAKIRQMLAGTAILAVVDLLISVAVLGLMLVYDWKLALLSVAFLPFFALSFGVLNPLVRRRSRELMETAAETQSHLVETLGGMVGVKCAAAAPQVNWTTDRRLGRFMHQAFGLDMLDSGVEAVAHAVSGLGTLLVLWYGAYQVIGNQLSTGQLVAFYSLVGMLLSPVERLLGLNRAWQDALVAADRLLEILELPLEDDQNASALTGVRLDGTICFDAVSFHFPGRLPLFTEFRCAIPGGKTTAIFGPSGSGKSTLGQMLNRLQAPDGGRITIGDVDLRNVPLATLRRRVGYVSTTPFLFAGTIRDNIQLGLPEAPFDAVLQAAKIAQAHGFVEQLPQGYDTVLTEGGSNLSTGQRLRLVVARAVLARPHVLILDEVSSLLDPLTEAGLIESLRAALPSLTLILITHRQTARQWVDHVVSLDAALGQAPEDLDGAPLGAEASPL